MTFIVNDSKFKIKQITPGENMWFIRDGMTLTPRAGFEISQRCPENYRDLIQECIRQGWIKPVATVYDHELTFARMKYE